MPLIYHFMIFAISIMLFTNFCMISIINQNSKDKWLSAYQEEDQKFFPYLPCLIYSKEIAVFD